MAKYLSHKIRYGLKDDMMYEGWCSWEMSHAVQNVYSADGCGYNRHRTHWCVPFGVREAIFEIWGGGGSMSGSECCSVSTPSGSGAYARKKIPVYGGECYFIHVGYSHCCRSERGEKGNAAAGYRERARDTYVIGRGLSNFCAEVGYSGVNLCLISNQFDSSNAPAYGGAYRRTGTTTAMTGDSSAFYCAYTALDSGCAKAYGGDANYHGLPGFIMLPADSNHSFGTVAGDKPCAYKMGIPYPGGQFGCKAGHIIAYVCNGDGLGGHDVQNKAILASGFGCTCNANFLEAGWGMHGGWTHSSNCCCGGPSRPGRVRITYR